MTLPLYPNDELVAVALLGQPEFFGTSDYCAMRLPVTDSGGTPAWMSTGFVVVGSIGGGSSNEVPMNNSVIALDCFAAPKRAGADPPWGQAANLAEVIRQGCWKLINGRPQKQYLLTLPGQFPKARVYTAYPVTKPRRLADPSSYARYTFQIQINWGYV